MFGANELSGYDVETDEGKEKCAELVANSNDGPFVGVARTTAGGGNCYGCENLNSWDNGNNSGHMTYKLK
jgi:hypothetical protein